MLTVSGARLHNLKNITVQIPLGVMVGVAGVSGSGKSSLIADTLVPNLKEQLKAKCVMDEADEDDEESGGIPEEMISAEAALTGTNHIKHCFIIDQRPIGRSRTSCPATYTGIFDRVRTLFAQSGQAKRLGYTSGMFSVNSKGGCHKCIPSLDEPIYQYIPEFGECREPFHRMITIRHLLTMTSGIYWNGGVHYHCPMMKQLRDSGDWISYIADCAVADIPGTKYNYKEWDVILLAKLLEKACGDLYDFINATLFEPLEIESTRWYQSPCGVYYSVGNGAEAGNDTEFRLTAIDMMKIGRLFLHGGKYGKKQILSENYIHQAVSPLKCNPNYGFLWWIWGAQYGCRGYGGQSITVIPDENAVIVTQATPTDRGMGYSDVVDFCRELLG